MQSLLTQTNSASRALSAQNQRAKSRFRCQQVSLYGLRKSRTEAMLPTAARSTRATTAGAAADQRRFFITERMAAAPKPVKRQKIGAM